MSDIIGMIITGVLWTFVLGIFILLGIIINNEIKYKNRVIIKEVHNGMKLTNFDKAREIVKEDGTVWWKLRKAKAEIPPPPNECIEVDKKGKKVIQLYRIDGGEYIPAKDGFDLKDKGLTQRIINAIQPFTASQRQMLVNQHRKSVSNLKSSLSDMISKALPYMAAVMLVVMFMLFFGEAVQPMIDVGDQYTAVSNNLVKVTNKLDDIINDKVTIIDYETPSPPNSTPPN